MNTISDIWRQGERRWPGRTALAAEGERLDYGGLGTRIRQIAVALARRWQLHKGDVVALLAPNCIEFVTTYFACTAMGAIVLPVDERLEPDEARLLMTDSAARFAIVHRSSWPRFAGIRDKLDRLEGIATIDFEVDGIESCRRWIAEVGEAPDADPPAVALASDIAELMYTSGTTGQPKGVMRSHANVLAACGNARRAFGYGPQDRIAIVMPISHSSALVSQTLPVLEVGGTVRLVERFDAASLIELMRSEDITCLRAVPALFRMLLPMRGFDAATLPHLRLLMNSSAAIDPQTCVAIKERFPAAELINSYGLTEASTCSILADHLVRLHPDSIGLPIDGVEMRIADDADDEAGPGQQGEIRVRGPHVFVGYHGRPAESRAAFDRFGWLRTGDLGHRDEHGLFYFHGRRDDVINCGGRKFSPQEVEDCILEINAVAEAAVVGAAHRVLGEVAQAFVVARPGQAIRPKAVIGHCARRLPSHKIPFRVEIVDSLPRNSVGKVLRRTLRNGGETDRDPD
ncbi:MAG: acyl--CoA ligase [Burkholderiaceae bacterium]|nr:acyl--CoA ligase [Burkholderiaceae bacterium]